MTSRDLKGKLVNPIRLERNISKTAGGVIEQQPLITRYSAARQYKTVGYPTDSLASCMTGYVNVILLYNI